MTQTERTYWTSFLIALIVGGSTMIASAQTSPLDPNDPAVRSLIDNASRGINVCGTQVGQTPFTIDAHLALTYNGFGVSCFGECDGMVEVTVTGGSGSFSYAWIGGPTTAAWNNVCAANQIVLVRDLVQNITCAVTVDVTDPSQLTVIFSDPQAPTCAAICNGSAGVFAVGGVPPYTYNWNSGTEFGQFPTQLCVGPNNLVVTDDNSCLFDTTFILSTAAVQANEVVTDVSCFGVCDGMVVVTATGGTPTYIYNWTPDPPNGDGTNVASGLCEGPISLTITDSNGCDTTLIMNIQQPVAIDPNLTTEDATCSDVCDGTAAVNPNSGVGSFSFDWQPGSPAGDGTAAISGLCAGNWSVTITDNATSCDSTINFVIGAPPTIDPSFTATDALCFGDCDGTISFNPSGGTPTYNYTWTPAPPVGDGTANGSGLCAGDWTVVITDIAGCDTTVVITIGEPDALFPNETFTDVSCSGGNDGTIDLAPSGGTPGYDYVWNPPVPIGNGTPNASGLTAGVWMVTISDDNDCDTTLSVVIGQPLPLQVTTTQIDASCNGECDGSIVLAVNGGTPGYNFAWTPTPLVGDGTAQISGLCAGPWEVLITDDNGCELTQLFTIAEPSELMITMVTVDATCGNNCDGEATATVSGGTPQYDYFWDPAPQNGQGTSTATGFCPGPHTLTITDDQNCDSTITFNIGPATGILPNEAVTPASCADICDGSIILNPSGGIPQFTYLWSPAPSGGPNVQSANDLCPDIYTITITDLAGCDTTMVIEIASPPAIDVTVSSTDISCFGDDDGTIDLTITGGTPTMGVVWTPQPAVGQNSPNVSGLYAGTWQALVTDGAGCDTLISVGILEPTAIDPGVTFTQPTCGGGCDGTANVNPTGGTGQLTVTWNPAPPEGPNALASTQLCPDVYNVTVSDENGCDTIFTFELIAPVAPMVAATVVNASCNDTCDGSIQLQIVGGVAPTFVWSPQPPIGDGTAFGQGLCADTYSITVSDQGGCDTTLVIDVTAPPPFDIGISSTDVTCAGFADGTIDLVITGGSPTYTIVWSPVPANGQGTPNISGLPAGFCVAAISDVNGCDTVISVEILEPLIIDPDITLTQPTCGGGCDGMVTLNPSGGTGPLTVFWNPAPPEGQGVLASTQLCPDIYSITVTDANGCDTTTTFELISPTAPIVQPTVTNTTCGDTCDGSILLNVTGANSPTFTWSPPVGNGTSFADGLCAGSYMVTVTDITGCDTTLTIAVGSPDPIVPNETWSDETCNGPCDGTITLNPTGGDGNFSILWSPVPGIGGLNATGVCAGSYTGTLTDGNGCDTTITVTILSTQTIEPDFSGIDVSCPGLCDGQAMVNPIGGVTPYTFVWSPQPSIGQGTNMVSGLCAGGWSVLITDSVGCDTTVMFIIQKPSPIVPGLAIENEDCTGPCTGAASVSPYGAFGDPFTITWSPLPAGNVQGNNSIINACAGTYSVNIADAMGCDTTVTFDVGTFIPFQAIMVITPSNCVNECDGTASVSVTGGELPYTYQWTPPPPNNQQGDPMITGLCAGNYSVLVTDNSGCDTTIFFDINEPTALNIIADVEDATCNDECDGVIIVVVSGGTVPYNYVWSPVPPTGQNTNVISGLCAGDWTLFMTDANGCDTAITYTVGEPTAIAITPVVSPSHCQVCDGAISVALAGGTPGYIYSWTDPNGVVVSTNDTLMGLCAGIYTLALTDDNGCEATAVIPISDADGEVLTMSDGITNCFNTCDGEVTASFICSEPTCVITWYDALGVPIGQTDTTATGLCPGLYVVGVQNGLGCLRFDTAFVSSPPAIIPTLTTTSVTCNGDCNGTASVIVTGGVQPYTYLWGPGNPTGQGTPMITSLCGGAYTLTITDAELCDTTLNFIIDEPAVLDPNGTVLNASCTDDTDGEIVLNPQGGTAGYQIFWNPVPPNGDGTIEAFDLAPGTYMVTLIDANGCDTTATYVVGSNPPVILSATSTNSQCQICDGTATVNITGGSPGFFPVWTDAAGTQISMDTVVNNLCAGLYTVYVSDQENCDASLVVPISDADGESITATAMPTSCIGNCDGTITATFTCDEPPCVSTWYNGAGTPIVQNVATLDTMCAGTYIFGVVNNLGCISFDTTQVVQGDELIPNLSTTPVSCAGECDGTAAVNPTGGVGPYIYVWTDPQGDTLLQNTPSVSQLCDGAHIVYITDQITGCSLDQGVLILEPQPFTINAALTHVMCGGECTGSIVINSSGGTGQHNYTWSPALPPPNQPNASQATDLCAGAWTVTITDATGCDTTITYTILEPAPITLTTSTTQSNCQICDGTAMVVPSGGVAPYQYDWADGSGTVDTDTLAENLCAGLYTITVTDANNCSITAAVPITDLNGELLTTTDGLTTCTDSCDGSVSVAFTCSVAPCTISWSDAAGTVLATDTTAMDSLCVGDYIVTVINGDGCSTVDTATVVGATPIDPNLTTTPISCNSPCDASATVSPSGGAGGYQYLWMPGTFIGQGTPMVIDLCAGTYSVQIQDVNLCETTQTFTINDPTPIDPNATITNAMCNGSCNGSIALSPIGGTGPYTYFWDPPLPPPNNQGDSLAIDLCPMDYTVTISDQAGCDTTVTFTIIDQAPILVNVSTTNNVCFGDCQGSAFAVFTGGAAPYTIEWQDVNGVPFATDTNAVSGLCAGDYIFSITDTTGCTALSPFTIDQGAAIEANLVVTNETCMGPCDGTATINPTGGTGPLAIVWSGSPMGQGTTQVTGLCAGQYSVTLTDSLNCDTTYNLVILPYTGIAPNAIVDSITCSGFCDGSITIAPSGGVGPYSYVWMPPVTNPTPNSATDLCGGSWSVTVTDSVGCDTVFSFSLTDPPLLEVTVDQVIDATCSFSNDGSIDITISGGVPLYNVTWNGPNAYSSNDEDISGLLPGTYIAQVIDDHNCLIDVPVIVAALTTVIADAGADTTVCPEGSAVPSAANSVGGTSLTWTDLQGTILGTDTILDLTGFPQGTYQIILTVSDGAQCVDSDTVSVNVLVPPTVDAGPDQSIFLNETAQLGGSPTGPAGSMFFWSPDSLLDDPFSDSPIADPDVTTWFVVSVLDPQGCTSTDSVLVTVIPDFIIPSGFSPNGDGQNDDWQIDLIDQFPAVTVEIYNRWGEMLFESVGYKTPWNGEYEGEPVPIGTYYYVIELNDPEYPDPYTGPLTVLR